MNKIKEFWSSLDEDKTVRKKELFFEITACIMTGIVIGTLFSPKKHIMIGSNNSGNGCNNEQAVGKAPKEK